MKKISVVIPTYNYAAYLPDAINSLLKQTHLDWECFIIDNGSTDNTETVINEIIKNDNRFFYIQTERLNPSAARNIGIKKSSGNFIQLLDADDVISADKFEKQLDLFERNEQYDIVYGAYRLTDQHLQNIVDPKKDIGLKANAVNNFIVNWERKLTIPPHSFLFKKSCFEKWGLMDETIRTHEDWELLLNFSANGANYFFDNNVVAFYRIHQSSSSRTDRTRNRFDTFYVLMKYFKNPKLNTRQKLLILIRYCDFVAETIIDKIRFNNVNIAKAVSLYQRPLLNLIAFLSFPCFVFYKLIRKLVV